MINMIYIRAFEGQILFLEKQQSVEQLLQKYIEMGMSTFLLLTTTTTTTIGMIIIVIHTYVYEYVYVYMHR